MTKIYKRSDRIKLQIDDLVVTISPLTLDQKTEAQSLIAHGKMKSDYKMITDGIVKLIKYSVRDIQGLENFDGSEFKVEMEDGVLAQESLEAIFNIELHSKLTMVCMSLLGTFPKEFKDEKGNPIEGVSFVKTDKVPEQNPN